MRIITYINVIIIYTYLLYIIYHKQNKHYYTIELKNIIISTEFETTKNIIKLILIETLSWKNWFLSDSALLKAFPIGN